MLDEGTTAVGAPVSTLPGDTSTGATPSVHEGQKIGRYVVVGEVGHGGMGVVLRAYDPKLRREVALKVMRSIGNGGGRGAQGRMLREAQALARLRSPNVVAVYDAEITDVGVCIAMEYVEGRTLRTWLEERARTWVEVVEVVGQVARGLAAAHAAQVVHRDIKPGNVLVGRRDQGRRPRVWLTDFGLAREPASDPADPDADGPDARTVGASGPHSEPTSLGDLTRADTLLGTPGYIAPEQYDGRGADARSDQFALCVTLWEALYGRRAFSGDDLDAVVAATKAGPPPPPASSVPRWLHAIVARGLQVDPDRRWPSVDALADALASGRGRVRRRRAAFGIAVVGVAVAGIALQRSWDRRARVTACEAAGAAIDEVWSDEDRQAVRASLMATGAGHAEATAERLMPWLDAQAAAWGEARTEACLDARVRGRWEADLLDRAVWCLEGRRLELAALVHELRDADLETVTTAVSSAAALRHVGPCRDETLLASLPAPPTDGRAQVQAVRAEVSRAGAMQATGAYADGLVVARGALDAARAVGWPPLIALAEVQAGALLARTGAFEDAEAMQESGYFDARRAGATEAALAAADGLAVTVGVRLARPREGEQWTRHATLLRSMLPDRGRLREAASRTTLAMVREAEGEYAAAARLHGEALEIFEAAYGPDHPDVANALNNLAVIRDLMGTYDEAVTLHTRALAIRERALGGDHPLVADSLNNLAIVHKMTGAYDEAVPLYERALAIQERSLGPGHTAVSDTLNNLATLRTATGEYAEAAKLHDRALAIRSAALGPDHPDVAKSLANLANVRHAMGERDEAAALHARAHEIFVKAFGPDHIYVAQSLANLASDALVRGEHAEASRLSERALEIRTAALGAQHPLVASSLHSLAQVRHATGAYDEAAELHARALAIQDEVLGPRHPRVAVTLVGLARAELARERPAQARAAAERAVTLLEAVDGPAVELADAELVLARALVATDGPGARPRALATAARDVFRAAGDAHRDALQQAEAFLREHGGP